MKTKLLLWFRSLALGAGFLIPQRVAAAVSVYGEASSSGPTITVNVYADITAMPLLSFGAQLTYDARALYVQSASKNIALWYFSDGTNNIPYLDPDASVSGVVTILGGKLDARSPLQGVIGSRILLGTVTFGRTANPQPAAYSFALGLGQPTPFANFVATDGTVLDTTLGGVTFQNVAADPKDTNLNGLPDTWELKYFGALGVAVWSDDPDHDGFNNLQEAIADTNPKDSGSYPHITGVRRVPGGVSIEWQAGVQATQYLQRRFSLGGNGAWLDIFTNPPPTSLNNTNFNAFGANPMEFYRLRFAR